MFDHDELFEQIGLNQNSSHQIKPVVSNNQEVKKV
jgi:hypothetical protein